MITAAELDLTESIPDDIGEPVYVRIEASFCGSTPEESVDAAERLLAAAVRILGVQLGTAELTIGESCVFLIARFADASALIVLWPGAEEQIADLLVAGTRGSVEGRGLAVPGASSPSEALRTAFDRAVAEPWASFEIGAEG